MPSITFGNYAQSWGQISTIIKKTDRASKGSGSGNSGLTKLVSPLSSAPFPPLYSLQALLLALLQIHDPSMRSGIQSAVARNAMPMLLSIHPSSITSDAPVYPLKKRKGPKRSARPLQESC